MAFVPTPSPTVVDQTTLMKKYLQFVAALTDANTPDETKLKMMQEVSENFEYVLDGHGFGQIYILEIHLRITCIRPKMFMSSSYIIRSSSCFCLQHTIIPRGSLSLKVLAELPIIVVLMYQDLVGKYSQQLVKGMLQLLSNCPSETAHLRKELLIAAKHILTTDLRSLVPLSLFLEFIPCMDKLFDESILIGSGYTARETLRPLAYSTLADLVHHVRQNLPLTDLSLAVQLFAKNIDDESLPSNIQTMSCKLLLNLVDCIRSKSEQENGNGRDILMRMLEVFVLKFHTIARYQLVSIFKKCKPQSEMGMVDPEAQFIPNKQLQPKETQIYIKLVKYAMQALDIYQVQPSPNNLGFKPKLAFMQERFFWIQSSTDGLPCSGTGLNMLQSGLHKQHMKDLFVELCLTVPVRLSSLLPYLPMLMDPLVSALNGSQTLVSQGLRTLELCVDNLQPDFLYDHIQPVRAELMQVGSCLFYRRDVLIQILCPQNSVKCARLALACLLPDDLANFSPVIVNKIHRKS
ncbi:hypothetical protein XENOCAPTIV_002484 [Xenoophorus captivus]|uniref:Transformation/transcription domain-associated protein n=1 Tax=Xenoophorus captivus TaxID=1517983 RepID=A0ABV0QH27_9TELE